MKPANCIYNKFEIVSRRQNFNNAPYKLIKFIHSDIKKVSISSGLIPESVLVQLLDSGSVLNDIKIQITKQLGRQILAS